MDVVTFTLHLVVFIDSVSLLKASFKFIGWEQGPLKDLGANFHLEYEKGKVGIKFPLGNLSRLKEGRAQCYLKWLIHFHPPTVQSNFQSLFPHKRIMSCYS